MLYGWILFLFSGCAATLSPTPSTTNQQLTALLVNRLHVRQDEAKALALSAMEYAKGYEQRYRLVKPPLFHNLLVNLGIKKRGLCWHFAYDLLEHLKTQEFKVFDYYMGGAHIDDYWQEHTSLVVTCKGCRFEEGVLLDAWRDSGKLFFAPVTKDATYSWTQRGGLR